MSVPVPKRSHGVLEVNTMAVKLCKYTIEITDNQKIFIRDHDYLIKMLQETAIEIQALCWEANNIRVEDDEYKYNRRLQLQSEAIAQCNRLYSLIEISKSVFHLTNKRAIYWSDLVIALKNKIMSWNKNNARELRPKQAISSLTRI